jgi:hypothetical protein
MYWKGIQREVCLRVEYLVDGDAKVDAYVVEETQV